MSYEKALRRLRLVSSDNDDTLAWLYRCVVGLLAFLVLPFAMAVGLTLIPAAIISWVLPSHSVLSVWLAGPLGGWGLWLSVFLTPSFCFLVWIVHTLHRDVDQTKHDPKYEDDRRYFFN